MAQVGSNDEKTKGRKSRWWTVPLRVNLHDAYTQVLLRSDVLIVFVVVVIMYLKCNTVV